MENIRMHVYVCSTVYVRMYVYVLPTYKQI